ncbi:uncharacterized protein LOC130421130 [Triplophysa dalaica]|uniref:uncharacterized protein LOC130421130 n=1 Tax=Triplophysa dalaica TaxID=1582913 RepID=UPI0024DFC5AD|nr:uncharacterized protein LOC130421130 [Triplophysa dalaica]
MRDIIPRNKTKGVDICAGKEYTYIIRSDLGCYMQISDLHKGSDLTVFKLHPSCQNGDHYLADMDGHFYIIKGESYRRVTDLSTDADAVVEELDPDFRDGEHYLGINKFFVVIFKGRGIFRITSGLGSVSTDVKLNLKPESSNGLYYWGLSDCCCFLKPVSKWEVEYCKGADLEKDDSLLVYSVHPDVVNFLPGGLSLTQGPAFGRWENIKSIQMNCDTTGTWRNKITKKVGFNKEKMIQIMHNWKICPSSLIQSGDLAGLIAKVQFSMSAEYGGSHVNTEKQSWNEVTEVEEELSLELKPKQCLYVWQYRLGFCDEPVLFCRDLIIGDEPNPPTEAKPLLELSKSSTD